MARSLLFSLAILLGMTSLYGQRNCGSHDHLLDQLQQYPQMEQNLQKLEDFTRTFEAEKALSGGVLTIPVVIHVVYRTSAENVSDAQINSQIQVLNDDFRRLNADAANTPSDFTGVAADTEIEFCVVDVIRKQTTRTSFGTNDAVKSAASGGSDVVNPAGAMNFWVCNIGGSILGYAQFPGGPAATDGVVVDYRYFGTTGTATAPFDLGRTATHEVGHYLNLRHIWGDGGCNVDDFVADTPAAGGPNYTGGSCTYPGPNSCRPKGKRGGDDLPDMFQNYMDYSDDGCMNLFTLGQRDRMWAAVQASRPGLLSAACDGTPPTGDPEICGNGIDDDLDGLTDCDDPDCGGDPVCDTGGGGGDTCDTPTGLSYSRGKGGREATISWNAVSSASSYDVEVYTGGSLYASGTVTGTSASFNTSKGTAYQWQVRANCGSVSSDFASASFTARLNGNAVDAALSAFPNPVSADEVTVSWNFGSAPAPGLLVETATLSTDATVTLSLHDVTGRRIKQLTAPAAYGNTAVDLSDVPSGIYLVRLTDGAGNDFTTRVVRR